jgi:hypothetical protein
MKKLIVAAAGLMLAGAMVSTASADAGVSFTGDARTRAFYQQDYNFIDSDTSNWNSRVRLKMKAESKGGAWAIARVRMADAKWDGAQDQTKAAAQGSNIYTDYAYMGTPIADGPVSIEGGLMPFNITTWSIWDIRTDAANVAYKSDMTTAMFFYHKVDEFENEPITGLVVPTDVIDDDDIDRYGGLLNQKFEGGWGLVASVWYQDDAQFTDKTGVGVAAEVTGAIGSANVLGTAAWYEADMRLNKALLSDPDNDPWGVYGQAAFPMGAVTLTGGVGYTADGFVADGDFGPFIMLSDVSNIATGIGIGSLGETTFAAFVPSFKVSEQLTLTGVFAYADIDDYGNTDVDSAMEFSGKAAYVVTDGATLTAEAGYLDLDSDVLDEPAIGAGVILDIAF